MAAVVPDWRLSAGGRACQFLREEQIERSDRTLTLVSEGGHSSKPIMVHLAQTGHHSEIP